MSKKNKEFKKINKFLKGECLCGAVSFKIKGELRNVINCHCSQCLRTHGHFSAYTQVEKKNLEFFNFDGLKWYNSSKKARRGFCTGCGASIFFERFGRQQISISAGILDLIDSIKSVEHIFFDEKPSYYNINDNLPKFSQNYLEKIK
tara:strand:+ start:386 stop:826 length:441 start_codon:yes stop_codon:yes gene_type:complete